MEIIRKKDSDKHNNNDLITVIKVIKITITLTASIKRKGLHN